jgi:lipopolysaccharide/colanic/teichoic acid biosynthesis glycosyltransferase
MESAFEVPHKPASHGLHEIRLFTKHILRVVGYMGASERSFHQDAILFSYVTVERAIKRLNNNEVIDGILFHGNSITDIKLLLELARKKAVPVIWYTPRFEQHAKMQAFHSHADDYHYGAITPVFLKKIEALRKLKIYKNERGNKPYETFTEDAPRVHHFLAKRVTDIFVSLTLLILLLPFLLLISLIIKLESKGPVFYISKRAGAGYRVFNFYKFRSMRAGAENELKGLSHINQYSEKPDKSIFFKIKNDPRVTPFGAFLRKTSLDEIPQLVNVLIGDMSLVGNRPLPLYEAAQLTNNKIAWRFLAPAGITGLWQITKRGREEMSTEERIALDMEYAMKCSFLLDVKILFSTLPALLQKEKV